MVSTDWLLGFRLVMPLGFEGMERLSAGPTAGRRGRLDGEMVQLCRVGEGFDEDDRVRRLVGKEATLVMPDERACVVSGVDNHAWGFATPQASMRECSWVMTLRG